MSDVWFSVGTSLSQGLGQLFAGLFSGGVVVAVDSIRRKRINNHRPLLRLTDQDLQIHSLVCEVRVHFPDTAIRAYLALYDNGSRYLNESEVIKYSYTHENPAPGYSYVADRWRNTLISWVPEETKLVDQPGPSFTRVRDIGRQEGKSDDGCQFRSMLMEIGVDAIARCAIRGGKHRKIVGFLGVDFRGVTSPPPNLEDLMVYAERLERLISSA